MKTLPFNVYLDNVYLFGIVSDNEKYKIRKNKTLCLITDIRPAIVNISPTDDDICEVQVLYLYVNYADSPKFMVILPLHSDVDFDKLLQEKVLSFHPSHYHQQIQDAIEEISSHAHTTPLSERNNQPTLHKFLLSPIQKPHHSCENSPSENSSTDTASSTLRIF